jgi:hypothetical protein
MTKIWDIQRPHRKMVLAGQSQERAARDQEFQGRAGSEKLRDQRGRGVDLLEVVKDDESLPIWQIAEKFLGDRPVYSLVDSQCPGNRWRHRVWVGDAGEGNEEDAAGELRDEATRDFSRQPALAHPTRTGEG